MSKTQICDGELRILAVSDISAPESTPLLLGLCHMPDKQSEMQILRLWRLHMKDGELKRLIDFPLRMHQSFYTHSVGSYSVNIPCPEVLAKQVWRAINSSD